MESDGSNSFIPSGASTTGGSTTLIGAGMVSLDEGEITKEADEETMSIDGVDVKERAEVDGISISTAEDADKVTVGTTGGISM